MTKEQMVEALLNERRGYVTRGLGDRVAAVDEQLIRHGYEAPEESAGPSPAEQRAASQAEDEKPKRRGRPPQQTAEQTGKSEA